MKLIWFGTKQKFQLVPCPAKGAERRAVASVTAGTLDRGAGTVTRSPQFHNEFEFNFPIQEAQGAGGLDVFREYAAGVHNDYSTLTDGFNPNDLIYFADPFTFASNMIPPHASNPSLCLFGWPAFGEIASHSATPANSNELPPRQVTFNVTTAANQHSADPRRTVLIPIPPGHTFRWHARGTRTGTGVVRAVAHHKTGGADLVQNIVPLAVTDPVRVGNDISGDTYDYVVIGLARTSGAASTVTVAGMVAQLHKDPVWTETRRNLASSPRGTALAAHDGANVGKAGIFAGRWFGGGGGAGVYSVQSGPTPAGSGQFLRKQWTVAGTSGDTGIELTPGFTWAMLLDTDGFPVSPGDVITVTVQARSNAPGHQLWLGSIWRDGAGVKLSPGDGIIWHPPQNLTADWDEWTVTLVAPAGAATVNLGADPETAGSWQPGDRLEFAELLLEKSAVKLPYLDGGVMPAGLDPTMWRTRWLAGVNESPSVLELRSGPAVPDATGPHILGQGSTGCQFLDDALPETYQRGDEGYSLKGLSFTLKEIGTGL